MNTEERAFRLTISLNVLEHLGINLYSNVPSVLSEIVANSWDADATEVRINWDWEAGCIVIQDDGIGMTPDEVNSRFLNVGYRRRDGQPGKTEKGRRPMGRKGIGKLSLFSIAKIVQVETAKSGRKSAFRMRLDDIRKKIHQGNGHGTYEPEILSADEIDFDHGTRIILNDLRYRQTISTPKALRKRVARRFAIIGEKYGFRVHINDEEVHPSDRDYYDKIQYLWTYGDQEGIKDSCSKVEEHEEHEERTSSVEGESIGVSGWLATVRAARHLKDEDDGDNLNRIAIFVRGKMAQEDILGDFSERGVYASYLIGELRVDGLDCYDGLEDDEDKDAATSSRQRIVENDPRYQELRKIIIAELKHIQNRWTDLRTEKGAKKALEIPEVEGWVNQLPSPDQKQAKKWFGKINRIGIDESAQQKQLIKHSVLAFAFYRANENLEKLDHIADDNLQATLDIFGDIDNLESSLYGLIVRQRLEIIHTLQNKIKENALERVIQKYLFDHLWLLDPSWERTDGTEVMESGVQALFKDVDADLSKEEKNGRLDIRYRKTAGQHVIIELKRPERIIRILDVVSNQIEKYYSGMRKILDRQNTLHDPIEIVLLLGKEPQEWGDNIRKPKALEALKLYNARVVFYDRLLKDAYEAYRDYLKKRVLVDQLANVMQAIDDFSPSNEEETAP